MNRLYRLVWDRAHGAWRVAAEIARGRGKGGRATRPRKRLPAWLLMPLLGLPPIAQAVQAPRPAPVVRLPATAARAPAGITAPGRVLGRVATPSADAAHLDGLTGGRITAGQGRIDQGAHVTTITQHSQTLSLAWQTFDVGADDSVHFVQPGADALAVNRIADPDGSVILGHLDANGQVWLINPNGILFGKGARVDVGGLVASTLALDGTEAGSARFAGTGRAGVVNRGRLVTAAGGYVALIGAQVSNQGSIRTPAGTTALGAGSAVNLQFDGRRLLSLRVQKGTLDALAENRQLIQADGGRVLMTAGAKDSLLASVVNNSGVIQARTVGHRDGRIVLLGGMQAGTAHVAGMLDASAPDGGDGGFVETSAAHVKIADDARITTRAGSGRNGQWLIDPQDFTIAASGGDITGAALSGALDGSDVTIQTTDTAATCSGATCGTGTSGKGDINVDDTVGWGSGHTLTLDAWNDININAPINVTGAGTLALQYGQQASAAGNTATYHVNAPVNLTASSHFRTRLGSDGDTVDYTIITSLGTAGSTSKTDLQGMAGDLAGHYALGADIDASATATWNLDGTDTVNGVTTPHYDGFDPIGDGGDDPFTPTDDNPFTGILDGLGHVIEDLTIDRPDTNYVGLFGVTGTGSELRNLGLVGGKVTGGYYVGSLVGANEGTISAAYATGAVEGTGQVGGLMGINSGTISAAYATGAVTGFSRVGGLVGENSNDGTIRTAHATGAVAGDSLVGGLVGWNLVYSTLSAAYATGAVTGDTQVGGLVGRNEGAINHAYATGAVTGSSGSQDVGGLVGRNNRAGGNDSGTISDGYWDTDTAGEDLPGIGVDYNNQTVTGLTTADLIAALPAGFDAAVWGNGDNQTTPYLLGLAGNRVFNANDLPATIDSDAHRPALYTVIQNVDQLQAMRDALSERYVLGNNIDASATADWNAGAGFAPVGDYGNWFTGILDGLDHTINDLVINRPDTSSVGLFGYISTGSELRNLGLVGGAVTGDAYVGGLVGDNHNGTISHAYATGAVTGDTYVGGLVGDNYKGTISHAHATGMVTGNSGSRYVGGLVGWNYGTIRAAYATGMVTGNSGSQDVGGLVGLNSNDGTIRTAHATGEVTGYFRVGGLVGGNEGTIRTAYATGAVTGDQVAGGLVGQNDGMISAAYATGVVAGDQIVGGLVGQNDDTISAAYATGAVTGGAVTGHGDYVGGLVGWNEGTIRAAYATGAVTGGVVTGSSDYVGGLVGWNEGTTSDSYWDTDTAGEDLPGIGGDYNNQTVTGLTTADLIAALPAGFDAAVWGNGDNQTTPYLLGLAGNRVFNVNDLPATIDSDAHRPALYTVIQNVDQLQAMQDALSERYVLGNDIDAGATADWNAGVGFVPVGDDDNRFTGTLDGLGHVIEDLTIDRPDTNHVGLFGVTGTGGELRNLGLVGGAVASSGDDVGGLVGENWGTISIAYATGTVEGSNFNGMGPTGGLVGVNRGTIRDAYTTGTVTGTIYVGGLVGFNVGTISNAYATGTVTGARGVGGLVGKNDDTGTIGTAYATGKVMGTDSTIIDPGIPFGVSYTGGLVGENAGTISSAYATGAATGDYYVGGLVGANYGTITDTYATGMVTGNTAVGGLVGENDGMVTDGYWDTDTTGQSEGCGIVGACDATAETTAQLIAALPAGFDAAVWGNGDNQTTPYLLGLAGNRVFNVNDTSNALYTVIQNVDQLQAMQNDLSGRYVLGNDIDASATATWNRHGTNPDGSPHYDGFAPIGNFFDFNLDNAFTGILDGLGHTINDLVINRPDTDTVGLFSLTSSDSELRNLGLVGGTGVGDTVVGGLVGINAGTISNAYATGAVTGDQAVGGLVGWNDGTIRTAYATGKVEGTDYVGGLVGQNTGMITVAYATGTVTGDSWVGGLVGDNLGDSVLGLVATINNAYATGTVTGNSNVGGLAGTNSGTISNTYATGAVTGSSDVGGLVGLNADTISTAYATGTVEGTDDVGGLVGRNDGGTVTDGYWDTGTTGQMAGCGDGGDCDATGKTTAELMQASTFDGWDLDTVGGGANVWRIYEGHTTPLLKAFLKQLDVTLPEAQRITYDAKYHGIDALLDFGSADPDMSHIFGTFNGGVASARNAGDYAFEGSSFYSDQQGYDMVVTGDRGTLTIAPALLIISTSDVTKTYDGTTVANGSTVIVDDTFLFGTDSLAGGIFAFTDKNAGTNKTVTVSGVTVNDGNDGNNYKVIYANNTTSIINPAALTLTDLAATDKVYDATTAATASANLSGVFTGDDVTATLAASFADKNVGTDKTVTVNGITLGGADAGNYVIIDSGGTTTAAITPATLTLADLSADDKVYDATTAATASADLSGVFDGDDVAVTLAASFADKNVGTDKTVTVNGVTLDGADAGNYVIIDSGGTATAAITPATLTLADLSADDKAYDATTAAMASAGLAGVLGHDKVTLDGLTASFADKNVGADKTVTVNGITLDGADAGNYVIDSGGTTTATITPVTLTLADLSADDKVYDATTAATASADLSGVFDGDDVAATLAASFADKNVGADKTVTVNGVTLTGTDAGNYVIDGGGTTAAAITPATLTYVADPASLLVGQPLAALGGRVTGLVGGDTLAGATEGELTWSTPATPTSPIGHYAITGGGLVAVGGNYVFRQAPGNATALTLAPSRPPARVTAQVAALQQTLTDVYAPTWPALGAFPDRFAAAVQPSRYRPRAPARPVGGSLHAPDIHVIDGGVRLP